MHSRLLSMTAGLSDKDLLSRVLLLARQEREATVELIGHLAELDARKLHLAQGYGSLFTYCTGALRLSEHAAYNRIEAARLSRRFPAVLDLLADGSLNVSTARLLAPHLRSDTFEKLVAQARGRSKREVEELVARLSPRPDVAASVRKLPARGQTVHSVATTGPVDTPMATDDGHSGTGLAVEPEEGANLPPPAAPGSRGTSLLAIAAPDSRGPSPAQIAAALEQPTHQPAITPLAPERYRVQFTIGAATHKKLRRAQELLRREIPHGDPGTIFDRALTLLLEDVARKKLAMATKPRQRSPQAIKGPGPSMRTRSRHVPARVKRAVWLRDGGRCGFVSADGRRCSKSVFLEFHHCEPYAIGGEATVANISLRCRAHNVYEAELAFGQAVPAAAMPGVRDAGGRRVNSPRGELHSRATDPAQPLAGP